MDLEDENKRYEEVRKKKVLEERTKLVKKVAGKAIDTLKKEGIDVDSAIKNILSGVIEKEEVCKAALLQTPREETSLTSELVYLMKMDERDVFYSELQRRLKLLNLSAAQQAMFTHSDLEALNLRKSKPSKDERWVIKYYIINGITKEDLLKPEECTLSELIAILDDANAAWVRDHEWLREETLEAVYYVLRGEKGKSPYHNELLSRTKKWKWAEHQLGSYIRNECMLLERWKWGYHDNPAWQEDTMIKPNSTQ
jgi:hypothetical protein